MPKFPNNIQNFAHLHRRVLAHYSQAQNIPSIMEKGILSRKLQYNLEMGKSDITDKIEYRKKIWTYDSKTGPLLPRMLFPRKSLKRFLVSSRWPEEAVVYFTVPKKLIKREDSMYSIVKFRVAPRNILAIKLPSGIPDQVREKIVSVAVEKRIPIYDYDGKLVFQPLT